MVRCQRSIGSWCLFSKWCPCYCSKRQASVGCKYTLLPCMIPLSKCMFPTFGYLLFLFHYVSFFSIMFPLPSLPLAYYTDIRPIQVINVITLSEGSRIFSMQQLSLQSYLLLFASHRCSSVTWIMWQRQQLTSIKCSSAKCSYLPASWNCELE